MNTLEYLENEGHHIREDSSIPKLTMMICSKAQECGICCLDKKPHPKELSCGVECAWHGKCIEVKE